MQRGGWDDKRGRGVIRRTPPTSVKISGSNFTGPAPALHTHAPPAAPGRSNTPLAAQAVWRLCGIGSMHTLQLACYMCGFILWFWGTSDSGRGKNNLLGGCLGCSKRQNHHKKESNLLRAKAYRRRQHTSQSRRGSCTCSSLIALWPWSLPGGRCTQPGHRHGRMPRQAGVTCTQPGKQHITSQCRAGRRVCCTQAQAAAHLSHPCPHAVSPN